MDQTIALKNDQLQSNLSGVKPKKVYTGTAARIIKLIGAGATQEEAAAACGVDSSVVSHMLEDQEFKDQIKEILTAAFKDAETIDANYQELEKTLSQRLVQQSQFMQHPDQILRVLKFANEAKRKVAPQVGNREGAPTTGNGNSLAPTILILPTVVTKEFMVNPNNEIVGVDGRELTTLNSTSLNQLHQNRKKELIEKAKAIAAERRIEKRIDKYANEVAEHKEKRQIGSSKAIDPYSDL